MNKFPLSGKSVRLALLCLLAAVMPALNSCKKETADTGDLLATVPSSAGMVVGVNLKSVLEKSGCEVDASSIVPGKEVTAWIDSQDDVKDSNRKALKLFLDGESGIDPSAAVFFTDAYNSYITASLADTKKFEEFVAGQSGESFTDAGNGVRTCGNVAMKGAQAWICVSSNNTVDANAVASYANLSEDRSFLSNKFASQIAQMSLDVVGWGSLKALSRQGFSSGGFMTGGLLMNSLFEDATAVSFNLDFRDGKAVGSSSVLNDKGENAKYLLPMTKIDVETVKSLGSQASLLAAMTVTSDFVKKVEKIGGSMISAFTDALKPVDGTVAVACGDLSDPAGNLSAVVTTNGDTPRDFMNILSQFGEIKKDGKLVRVNKGTLGGNLDVASAADMLKGSVLGIVIDVRASNLEQVSPALKTLAVALVPQGNGLKIDLTLEGADSSKNIILALIESDTKK